MVFVSFRMQQDSEKGGMLAGCLGRSQGPELEGAWCVRPSWASREPGTAWVPYTGANGRSKWVSEFSRAPESTVQRFQGELGRLSCY